MTVGVRACPAWLQAEERLAQNLRTGETCSPSLPWPPSDVHPVLLLLACLLSAVLQTAAGVQDPPTLGPGEVARVNAEVVLEADYLRYVGTVYAREPQGELALQQLLTERIVRAAAAAAGVEAGEAELADLRQRLAVRAAGAAGAAAATGAAVPTPDAGAPSLAEALGVAEGELERALTLLCLQEQLVAAADALPAGSHPSDERLRTWLEAALAAAAPQPASLESPVACTYTCGEPGGCTISRVELGLAVHRLLEPREASGVLTELIGILLIRARAQAAGLALTPEAAAEELTQREALVASNGTPGLTYEDVVQQMYQLSLEELVATPRFGAEVLLRELVEAQTSREQLEELFEHELVALQTRFGADVTLERAAPTLWKRLRERTYQRFFAESTIVRRF